MTGVKTARRLIMQIAADMAGFPYQPVPNDKPGVCAIDKLHIEPGLGVIIVCRDSGGTYAALLHGNCMGQVERIKKQGGCCK